MDDLEKAETQERIGPLADEFIERRRSAIPPTIDDFAARHPELADEIRTLFPVVLLLEESRPGDSSGHAPMVAAMPGSSDLLPRQLGEYEILSELGRGGMGIVYEARDLALDRRVAIKVLPRSLGLDERARRRFIHEEKIIARLRHPQIVPIHAVGEQDQVLYFVTDLIPGTSLDQLRTEGIVKSTASGWSRWVARLGIQAAEVLAFAHALGILHRDVKPSNFLLDQDGKLWLTDFGLARLLIEPSLTATGEWLGTLRYLAPEGLRGMASVRGDIYGLGLTLYELLAGRPAYGEVEQPQLVAAILETSPAPLRSLDPSIPRELESIVSRAIERDPELRYASAEELAADLRRFLEGHPIADRRASVRGRLVRWVRRNPAITTLSVICTLLAIALVILTLLEHRSQQPDTSAARLSAERGASGGGEGDPTASRTEAVRKQGPPYGFGRRFQGGGPGAGGGMGPRGPRRGFGPRSGAADRENSP